MVARSPVYAGTDEMLSGWRSLVRKASVCMFETLTRAGSIVFTCTLQIERYPEYRLKIPSHIVPHGGNCPCVGTTITCVRINARVHSRGRLGFKNAHVIIEAKTLNRWARQTIVVSRPAICLFGEENRPAVLVPHDVRRRTAGQHDL